MLIVRKCWHTWIHALYTWFTLPQKNWVTPVSFNKLPLSEALIYLLKLSVSCWMLPLNSDNVRTKSVADSAVVVSCLETWCRRAVAALGRPGSVLLVLVLAHFSLTNNPITSRACNYLPTFLFSATTSCSIPALSKQNTSQTLLKRPSSLSMCFGFPNVSTRSCKMSALNRSRFRVHTHTALSAQGHSENLPTWLKWSASLQLWWWEQQGRGRDKHHKSICAAKEQLWHWDTSQGKSFLLRRALVLASPPHPAPLPWSPGWSQYCKA